MPGRLSTLASAASLLLCVAAAGLALVSRRDAYVLRREGAGMARLADGTRLVRLDVESCILLAHGDVLAGHFEWDPGMTVSAPQWRAYFEAWPVDQSDPGFWLHPHARLPDAGPALRVRTAVHGTIRVTASSPSHSGASQARLCCRR